MPQGSSAHFCMIGTEKAIVLPVPVRDPPIQSLPFNISGMQAFWIPVGRLISMLDSEATSHGATSIVAKLALVTAGPVVADRDGWRTSRGFPGFTRDMDGSPGGAGASESDSG